MSSGIIVFGKMRPVHHAGDASDRNTVAVGDESAHIVFPNERRFSLVESPVHLIAQQGHIMLVAGLRTVRRLDERIKVGAASRLADFDRGQASVRRDQNRASVADFLPRLDDCLNRAIDLRLGMFGGQEKAQARRALRHGRWDDRLQLLAERDGDQRVVRHHWDDRACRTRSDIEIGSARGR